MNLRQLEAFIKVSDSKSFSKAAQELYLTQPTVSAHIQTLEKELKVRLFVRNTKTVKLSEDGKTLYQYARQMIELEQEIQSMFSKAAEQKESQFQIMQLFLKTFTSGIQIFCCLCILGKSTCHRFILQFL